MFLIKLTSFTRALLNFNEPTLTRPFLNHNSPAPFFSTSFL